jgi:hypothetical protein
MRGYITKTRTEDSQALPVFDLVLQNAGPP